MNFDSPAEARAWLRMFMGPSTRTLEGEERSHIELLLRLVDPESSSNNQRTCTDRYKIGGKEYQHIYGDGIDTLEEVLEDDIQ